MAIKEKVFSIFYSIKKICTGKDFCNGCPFQNDKGCEMKSITGTYPIAWKELKDDPLKNQKLRIHYTPNKEDLNND